MRFLSLVLCTALLPFAAGAVDSGDFRWQGKLKPGTAIEVKGINGNITARVSTSAQVQVAAHKSARRSDPNSVRVDVVEHADGVTICAIYPDAFGRPNECKPGNAGRNNSQNNDVKVDFTVQVPAGVRFIARTVNGTIDAQQLKSDVEANTVNGDVKVNTTGTVQVAKTVNGSIDADLGSANWSRGAEFTSVNGTIALAVPAQVSANVHASTVNGSINTDFPLEVTGKFVGRKIDGKLGNGGPPLKINTVNGSIKLRRAG